jgi:hypothetical protein
MHPYQGTLTEDDYVEVARLRRQLSPGVRTWWFRRPDPRKLWRSTPALREPYAGQVTESALEARLVAVDARIPWPAFSARAGSPRAIVLLAGHMCIPLARSFFASEEEWLAARAIVERCVPLRSSRAGDQTIVRTAIFWLVLVLVIFLAWHFAQLPKVH